MEDNKGPEGQGLDTEALSAINAFATSDAEPIVDVPPTDKGGGQGSNTDTPKAKDTEGAYSFLDDQEDDNETEDEQEASGEASGDQGNDTTGTLKEILQAQIAKTGKVVELPDDINDDNFAEKLLELGRQGLHPEVIRLQEAIEAGQTPEQYFESFSALDRAIALPDKELVRRNLLATKGKSEANPDGWDEEKITKRIERMGELELEDKAEEVRDYLKQQRNERRQSMQAGGRQAPDPSTPEFRKAFDSSFSAVFDDVMKDPDIYGLKLADPGKQKALKNRMGTVLYPDAKTRQNQFVEALQNPKEAMKMAMLWDMARSGALRLGVGKNQADTKRQVSDLLAKKRVSTSSSRAGNEQPDFGHFAD
jgi:hypothetical protein